jgi:hypothetical protein
VRCTQRTSRLIRDSQPARPTGTGVPAERHRPSAALHAGQLTFLIHHSHRGIILMFGQTVKPGLTIPKPVRFTTQNQIHSYQALPLKKMLDWCWIGDPVKIRHRYRRFYCLRLS